MTYNILKHLASTFLYSVLFSMEMLCSRAFFSWQATVNKFQPTTRRQNKIEDTSLEDCFIFFPQRNDHVLKGLLVAWKDCWLPADAGGLKETCWVLVWCLPENLVHEMPLAIIRYILHFGQSLPTFFLQRARSPLLISVQRTTFLQWHCLSRRECTVTKMPSGGAGWVPFCELYTGGHWRCLEPLKNQRCARNWQQLSKARENQTTCPFPTHSHQGLREFCGWQQKEYGRNRR